VVDNCCTSVDAEKMCEVASFKNFENSLATVKVMTKTKVAPFYLGHGVEPKILKYAIELVMNLD